MADAFTLVLDRRDMTVTMEGRALCVQRSGEAKRHVPLGLIDNVVVYGRPMVACDVWRALARKGIAAVLLPARGAGEAAWLGAGFSGTSQLRYLQYRAYSEFSARVNTARRVLELKLNAQSTLIEYVRGSALFDVEDGEKALTDAGRAVEAAKANIASTSSLAALMGHEGAAARAWFGCLERILPERWRFVGRNRRPPVDPVNALLSLTYTMAGLELLNAVQATGLDPSLGFLHDIKPGRNALMLDLLEILRPAADLIVLEMLEETLQPEHFATNQHAGCRLTKAGRGLYYRSWSEKRMAWPDLHRRHNGDDDCLVHRRSLSSCSRRAVRELCRVFV